MPALTLLPIFVYFLIGLLLRVAGLADREHGAFLFRIVFFVTLPALAFEAIVAMSISSQTALLPLSGFVINAACMGTALLFARARALPRATAGPLLLAAGIANMTFMFPFVLTVLGEQALAYAILFDVGNAIFVATVGYFVALTCGESEKGSIAVSLLKTLRSPPFIAIALAIIVNVAALQLPATVGMVLHPLGQTTIPLVLIALGITFSISAMRGLLPLQALLLRMPLGFAAGLAIVWLLGLDGTIATIVAVSAAAPIGFSSVTLAAVTRLDTEQAVGALSLSVGVGLFSTPALLWLLSGWFETAG